LLQDLVCSRLQGGGAGQGQPGTTFQPTQPTAQDQALQRLDSRLTAIEAKLDLMLQQRGITPPSSPEKKVPTTVPAKPAVPGGEGTGENSQTRRPTDVEARIRYWQERNQADITARIQAWPERRDAGHAVTVSAASRC